MVASILPRIGRAACVVPIALTLFAMGLAAPRAASAAGSATRQDLARQSCQGLRQAVTSDEKGDAVSPLLLASYRAAEQGGDAPPIDRALVDVAFVYDNALAGIALLACGDTASARRIADAVVLAVDHDPHFKDGRVRNAYQSGPVRDDKLSLPGYWDAGKKQWIADAYQTSTATGNVAWAALLLLNVHQAAPEPRYLESTTRLLAWIERHAREVVDPDGYHGGWYGWVDSQRAQTWKSTEHNLDVASAAAWAASLTGRAEQMQQGRTALSFVSRMWSPAEQRFFIGTQADGASVATDRSGLDAQLWPLLARPDRHCDWEPALAWVERHHRSGAGYGFPREPDGIWTEGSAQAAATLVARKGAAPEALWQLLASQRAGNGLYYATPGPRISTGLAIGPDSTSADFFYYHWPHLGATAWIALAATGWNPFTGKHILQKEKPCPT